MISHFFTELKIYNLFNTLGDPAGPSSKQDARHT